MGNILSGHGLRLNTAGEEDIVLGHNDSIDSSIYTNVQDDESTPNREISAG
jgi:hypothetical protein